MSLLTRLANDANGLRILTDWMGSGAEPVDPALAQARADVCKKCPLNKSGGRLEAAVASAILEQESMRRRLELNVDSEDKLKSCELCGCYLKLKVWVPMKRIRPYTTTSKFPEYCWMQTENKGRVLKVNAEPTAPMITIQRMAAHGDVIMASVVATKLHERGFKVRFVTNPICASTLAGHPHIAAVVTEYSGKVDVNLDRTYEDNIEWGKKGTIELFVEAANDQLRASGIAALDLLNLRPVMVVGREHEVAFEHMSKALRPWYVFIRGSAAWPNRRLNDRIFKSAVEGIEGSVFVTKQDSNHKYGAHVMNWVDSFRDLIGAISACDGVITTDTGPLHVAAALGKRTIVIETCNDTTKIVNGQTDIHIIKPDLECSPCHKHICPINKQKPPCQRVRIDNEAHLLPFEALGTVSAIVPVYRNDPDGLAAVREPIDRELDEFIVAWDGTPHKREYSAMWEAPPTGKRLGYGKTCNRGARLSTGEWLLFLNDDCILEPGAVAHAMAAGKSDPNIAVVGFFLRYPDGRIQHGGMTRYPGDIGFGHIDHLSMNPTVTTRTEMECVTFAAALVRRRAFYEVGAFDERFDCYSEDTDLCMRLRRAGWKVVYEPKAKGVHHESVTTKPWKVEMAVAAHRIFAQKWAPYFKNNPPGKLGTNWEGTK